MKICNRCILPETFPGIRFDENGVCNYCIRFESKGVRLDQEKYKYKIKFLSLLEELEDSRPERSYDVLMAYSGGKDSTYTLKLFRETYQLRVLALSFDNGFLSETAIENIRRVTDHLGVDHISFKAPWNLLKKIFLSAGKKELYSKKTLERASTICTSCIGLVKSVCLKTAVEQAVPLLGFGWSPGQAPLQSSIMHNNPAMVRMTQKAILGPLQNVAGEEVKAYFLNERHYALQERFPTNVHPMAFEYYEEENILGEIKKLGWTEPRDTDSNSSNCLLNAYANEVHLKRYGFHPYVWEIANMVREGVMDREEGYKKIYQEQRPELVNIAKEKLK